MRHYIKLYFTSLKRSMMSRWVYKKDTFIALASFLISNVCSILSIYFIVNSITALPNWDIWHLGFLYGFVMLPVAVDHLFSDELWLVSYRRVKNGTLDPYFMRPVPVLFEVLCETFQPEGFGELIVGIVMVVVCSFNISWPPMEPVMLIGMIVMLTVAVFFGALIITSLKILIAGLAFKFKSSGPLLQVVYDFISYLKYPIGIFPNVIRILLTFIFPFAIVISFPVNTLFGVESLWFGVCNPYILSLVIIGVALIMLFLSIFIWNLCIKTYESTGS